MGKRVNHTRHKVRRYWKGVRNHERTALRQQDQPRPATPRRQSRASLGRPVI